MKAIILTRYGPPDGLQLVDLDKPVPKDHEILVRVHAATVTTGDCEIRSLNFSPWLALPIRLMLGRSDRTTASSGRSWQAKWKPSAEMFISLKPGTPCLPPPV